MAAMGQLMQPMSVDSFDAAMAAPKGSQSSSSRFPAFGIALLAVGAVAAVMAGVVVMARARAARLSIAPEDSSVQTKLAEPLLPADALDAAETA